MKYLHPNGPCVFMLKRETECLSRCGAFYGCTVSVKVNLISNLMLLCATNESHTFNAEALLLVDTRAGRCC